ncbi:MAG TPA: glutaredoxin 3 [Candidatus Binatia bacterium]|nr:glutaredoxin 3 [Candidatus Binatia bacterium]
MPNVKVYTTAYCPYCVRAKALLKHKNVPFEEIDVGDDDALREQVIRLSGRRTVPQIFIDDRSIGGYDELKALDDAGELDALVGRT